MSPVAEITAVAEKREGIAWKRYLGPALRPLGLLALCIALSFLNENFFTLKNIISVLRQSTILIVVALGMTAVILTAGIDLSASAPWMVQQVREAALAAGRPARLHLDVDTGLNRAGATAESWPDVVDAALAAWRERPAARR